MDEGEAGWADLPEELLCHILAWLPNNSVAPVARTCRRWFACSSPSLRTKFSIKQVCSRLELLQWAVQKEGCPMDTTTSAMAASSGQLETLWWAVERPDGGVPCPWNEMTCWCAARRGDISMLRWTSEKGCPWQPQALCEVASSFGHLAVLKWVIEEQGRDNIDYRVCHEMAERKGQAEVMQWIHDKAGPVQSILAHPGYVMFGNSTVQQGQPRRPPH
ncbi:Ankyrin repeat-containing domain [Balamuthia mandrillaris]